MNQRHLNASLITAAASVLLAITMGSRSSFGLFVSPLNSATGLGLAAISFAAAVSQLVWGAAQPAVGALADRHGTARVIAIGGLLLALSSALVPWVDGAAALVLVLAISAAAGAAVGSNALLLGVVSRHVPAERRGLATGLVGAGGSAGQLLLAPATQGMIAATGWVIAMFALSALALAALPLSRAFRQGAAPAPAPAEAAGAGVREALGSRSFWLIVGGFFVCGFHVSFLVTHMPGAIELCGLPAVLAGQWLAVVGFCNIVGSIVAGAVIQRVSMSRTLSVLYALRAIGVAAFLAAPKTERTLLAFGVWMGLTYMATLPPTSGLVARLFGVRHLATLLGVVMFAHQVGAFLGVWLGGVALETTGSLDGIWWTDIALAVLAAAINLFIREAAPAHRFTPVAVAFSRSLR